MDLLVGGHGGRNLRALRGRSSCSRDSGFKVVSKLVMSTGLLWRDCGESGEPSILDKGGRLEGAVDYEDRNRGEVKICSPPPKTEITRNYDTD